MSNTSVETTRHSSSSEQTTLQNLINSTLYHQLICSIMSDRHLQYERLSNSSNGSEIDWGSFIFTVCESREHGVYFLSFFSFLCFAFGFPACMAILCELFNTHRRGTPFSPNDIFMLNLSVMDLVFLVFIPPGLVNLHIWQAFTFNRIWNLIYALNTTGRPLLMACICVDCYVAVVHPVIYRERKSLTPRVLMVAAVWALTVAFGLVNFINFMLYFSMLSTVPFIIAITIVGICDFFILRALKRSDPGRPNVHPQKQRAIQTLINSLVMTVISYLPPVLLTAVGRPLLSTPDFICFVGIPITLTSTLGSAVMPILYLNNLGKLDRFRFGCCRKSHP